MHVHIVPLLAFLHMYVCLYVCNQSNQINQSNQEKLISKLNNFFVECLLPELMTHDILDGGCSSAKQNS